MLLRYPLTAHDADCANHLRISGYFEHMQHAASLDGERIGLGYEDMKALGLLFVLSRVKLRFYREADRDREMSLETDSRGCNRIMFIRDYAFRQDGELIAYGTSAWSTVSFDAHRIARPPRDVIPAYTPEPETLAHMPGKILIPEAAEPAAQRTVLYSDIDFNGHMNNARYVEWATDLFSCGWHAEHRIEEFEINYLAEAMQGETLTLYRADEEHTSTLWGVKPNGVTAFAARILYR